MSRRVFAFILAVAVVAVAGALAVYPRRPPAVPLPTRALDLPALDAPISPIRFTDVTEGSGVSAVQRNGEEAGFRVILESLGSGLGLFDFDGDGGLDLFLVGGGRLVPGSPGEAPRIEGVGDRLYRNLGGWRFEDVTEAVGLGPAGRYGHGCAVGDYDNDGHADLLVVGYGGVTLYRNEGGRRFKDVTHAAGLDRAEGWCVSAAWADFNNDGRLDLYVVRYVDWSWSNNPPCVYRASGLTDICTPTVFQGGTDLLFRNVGGGAFEEVGGESGLLGGGKGLGVVAADLDGDRATDLYVANDTSGNRLYRNLGAGTFEEMGAASGASLSAEGVATGSMGVDAGDVDGDGDMDLFVSNYEGEPNELYRNEGGWSFIPLAISSGLGAASRPLVGWGTGLADLDGDGRLDVFVANGHLMHQLPGTPRPQRPLLYRQAGPAGRFVDARHGAGAYFEAPRIARASAFGDLDNDGDLDLVVSHLNGPPALLRNDSPPSPSLRLRLEGGPSNRQGVGATVVVVAGGRLLSRAVKGGGSYLAHGDDRLTIGLGSPGAESVEVRWQSGAIDRHGPLEPGTAWHLREGAPPRPDPRHFASTPINSISNTSDELGGTSGSLPSAP